MDSLEALDREVRRLRDRAHKLESTVAALELITSAAGRQLDQVCELVEQMTEREKIAFEIARHDREQRTLHLNVSQKLLAAIIGLASLADLVLRFAHVGGAG